VPKKRIIVTGEKIMINEVWPIELGAAVGPFRLGDSIAEVLHALKVRLLSKCGPLNRPGSALTRRRNVTSRQSRLPVRPFEIIYDAADPYHNANVIESSGDGLRVGYSLCYLQCWFVTDGDGSCILMPCAKCWSRSSST
jgi:hypothetical protein